MIEQLKLKKLPLHSPFYCNHCKCPLSEAQSVDHAHAWCGDCEAVVQKSAFGVPSWTVGTTVLLFLNFLLM